MTATVTCPPVSSGALFSCDPENLYRYRLWRRWGLGSKSIAFILLNPSTADETKDDPTVRRCIGYAKKWGYDGLEVLNIFALRSTDPAGLRQVVDAVGPENNEWLLKVAAKSEKVICGWGMHGVLDGRGAAVAKLLESIPLYALHLTDSGHPGHPLYLSGDLKPFRWKI